MFKGLPGVPSVGDGVSHGMYLLLQAVHENLQVLMEKSVLTDSVTLQSIRNPTLSSMSYEGAVQITTSQGGEQIAPYEDVVRLAQDVRAVATDVAYILQVLDLLITQLRRT